ncbi:SGNH/GDSL hydrolase family protein [Vulgatibacter sp.]|uniref:SGNH/GDSL hydrolase family protein n=1 Tax=Vulgatibacter sp. TaxID=1971226 RepID=UPI00356534D8
MRAAFGLVAAVLVGCGVDDGPVSQPPPEALHQPPDFDDRVRPGTTLGPRPTPETGKLPVWQPGFHQALRWEVELAERTTLRIRVPSGRAGNQIRLAFRTGDGRGVLHGATVALAGSDGALASDPVAVTFGGEPGFSAGARERRISDPLRFPVGFRQELYVTYEVEGHFAAGAIDLFPDSWAEVRVAPDAPVVAGWSERRAIGLASLLVRAPASRAFVALGDSITEAFISGDDDYRDAWPQVAEALTGLPIANAGVSGQGLWGAHEYLEGEVLQLEGVTDCIVLLGTNDLGAHDENRITSDLARLFERLEPFCTVWAGTLVPKDRAEIGEAIRRSRRAINTWIREEAAVAGVIDFEAVLGDPANPDRWLPGLGEDGVHPSLEGQRVMGEEAARFLTEEVLGTR